MKYIKIEKDNIINGPGVRVVLWFSGCEHHCKDCHNPETWDPTIGLPINGETVTEIFNELHKDHVKGLSLSGGDPFYKNNRDSLFLLVKSCKEAYPDKDIWCWTGYNFEDIKDEPAMKYIDILVDGRFSMT